MADTVCMGIVVMQIIGRWGNFFNRESFGGYTDNPVAMEIPVSFVPEGAVSSQMKMHMETMQGVEFVRVHPTFLYESLWCLILLLFLVWYRRYRRFQGEMFLVYVGGYSLGRVWMETFRLDKLLIPGTEYSISQVMAGILVILCFLAVTVRRIMAKKRREARLQKREEAYAVEENSENQDDILEINLEYYPPEDSDREEKDFFEQEHTQQK